MKDSIDFDELTSLMNDEEKEIFMNQPNVMDKDLFHNACNNLNKYEALNVALMLLRIKKYFSQDCFNVPIVKEK